MHCCYRSHIVIESTSILFLFQSTLWDLPLLGGTPGGCLKESCNRHSHGKKDFDIRTEKSNRQTSRDDGEWHMKCRVPKNTKMCLAARLWLHGNKEHVLSLETLARHVRMTSPSASSFLSHPRSKYADVSLEMRLARCSRARRQDACRLTSCQI